MTVTTRSKSPEKPAPNAASARSSRKTTPQPITAPPGRSLTPSPQRSSFESDAAPGNDGISTKPVREQLKRATIATRNGAAANDKVAVAQSRVEPPETQSSAPNAIAESKEDDDRPRPRRKRSFEEVEESSGSPVVPIPTKHIRKRSREALNGAGNSDAFISQPSSPERSPDKAQPVVQDAHPVQVAAADIIAHSTSNDDVVKAEPSRTPNNEEIMSHGPSKIVGVTEKDAIDPKAINNSEPQPDSESLTIPESAPGLTASKAQSPTGDLAPPGTSKQNAPEETRAASSENKAAVNTTLPDAVANVSSKTLFKAPDSVEKTQTTVSSFANSGFASLAGSSSSPFATLASKVSSITGTQTDKTQPAMSLNGFASVANTSTASPFGSLGSKSIFGGGAGGGGGFGNLGGGLGYNFGSGGHLTSFASLAGAPALSETGKSIKGGFGAPAGEDEDSGDGGRDEDGELGAGGAEAPRDERFHEQDIETGEENETTVYQVRGKLYTNIDKQWKERGSGNVRLNVTNPVKYASTDQAARNSQARFIMRADGSYRIVLNSPVKKEIQVQDPSGGVPKGKSVCFLGFEQGKPVLMQLKLKTNAQALDIYHAVKNVQNDL